MKAKYKNVKPVVPTEREIWHAVKVGRQVEDRAAEIFPKESGADLGSTLRNAEQELLRREFFLSVMGGHMVCVARGLMKVYL